MKFGIKQYFLSLPPKNQATGQRLEIKIKNKKNLRYEKIHT